MRNELNAPCAIINNSDKEERKMQQEVCVTTADYRLSVPVGTTYGEVLAKIHLHEDRNIVLVRANGRLRELNKPMYRDAYIEPVRLQDPAGYRAYQRSLSFLFLYAVHEITKGDTGVRTILHFSAGPGFYYTIEGMDRPLDQELLEEIRACMKKTIDRKLPILKKTYNVLEAKDYFSERNMMDKVELMRFRRSSWINLYSMGGVRDYFYGYMVPDTSFLSVFDLMLYKEGIILVMAEHSAPTQLRKPEVAEQVFDVRDEHEKTKRGLNVENVADLNASLCSDGLERQIVIAEARQERNIAEIAQTIASRDSVKFVLIAGPSSSGKTTFCNRLSTQLATLGLTPHPISLDNYYKNRLDCPRDEAGNPDFECLEALDVELFNKDMTAILNGETVELPVFNFKTGKREYKGNTLKLKEGELLVLEGIHGLNDDLTKAIPSENKYRIYISALTCLNVDDHNRISTRDSRLLRRIVRDYRTRATSARETIAMWPKVAEGEDRYIFPNQCHADVVFNSALIYELGILKTYAEPLLFAVPEGCPEEEEARRLLKFLEYFLSLPEKAVPNHSILREFIGGSVYDVG